MEIYRCRESHKKTSTYQIPLSMEHGQQNVEYGSILRRSRNKNAEELCQANGLDRPHKKMKGWNPNKEINLLEEREPQNHSSHREIRHMEEPRKILVPQDMEEESPYSPQQFSSSRPYKQR
ncbi:hypothetical protein O181_003443 [Austropuccinia psidii MF-1]|uniref:Uncharacterized protein n=1 Tax=Austropuccinia psidii MF-1 TaxID=1389203 RepID=A0A9Q3BEG8_9BASI|nr:hypothetical protein [Austropuccinia psidii MF-1]